MILYSSERFKGEFVSETYIKEVEQILDAGEKEPELWIPVRGENDRLKSIFQKVGYELIPTVMSTTVLRKVGAEGAWYVKIYHALKWKDRIRERLRPRALRTYLITRRFQSIGLQTPEPLGWCYIKGKNKSLIFTKQARGDSLYDIFIRKKTPFEKINQREVLEMVLNEMLLAHKSGVYFGDLHLGHIYITERDVEFIDLDSVKFRGRLRPSEMARNLAGLNHPALPLEKELKSLFLKRYTEEMGLEPETIKDQIMMFTEKRYRAWKG